MVGILIIAHGTLGESLIQCAAHVFGVRPPHLDQVGIDPKEDPRQVVTRVNVLLSQLDQGDGVLVLSDLLGATPCNIARDVLRAGHVEGVSGVNLSMLIRSITYRRESLSIVVQKAMAGGTEGVQHLVGPNAAT
jgi:PTS system ascorbate-specific IIA component